jgi:hypothetical protein
MNLQSHGQDSAPLDLKENCIYMPRDGTMLSHAKTAEFFRTSGRRPEFRNGRTLALHCVSSPEDVHYPVWEMHPEGDELLILASGSLSVDLREGKTERTVPLSTRAAFIVRAGIWHRLIVHEPSVLIAVTQRHNTVHEPERYRREQSEGQSVRQLPRATSD